MKILIIDDSLLLRIKIRKLLQKRGYEVSECSSAEEAIALCREESFDLLLLDLLMPGMGGIGFLTHTNISSKIPVLVITAETRISVKQECIKLGAIGFLTKPLEEEVLIRAIEQGLNGVYNSPN